MNPTVSTPITLSPAPMPSSAPSIANSTTATRSAATSHDGLRRGIWATVVGGMRVVGSSKLAVMVEFLDRRPSGRLRACRRGTDEAVHQGARRRGDGHLHRSADRFRSTARRSITPISSVAARTLAAVAKDEPTWLPVTCAGCVSRWYGIERAHCVSCHRTFAAVDLFDQHRVDHLCRNPASLG